MAAAHPHDSHLREFLGERRLELDRFPALQRVEARDELRRQPDAEAVYPAARLLSDLVLVHPGLNAPIGRGTETMAISPEVIASAIVFTLEQPAQVDVGEIIVRPTAQG